MSITVEILVKFIDHSLNFGDLTCRCGCRSPVSEPARLRREVVTRRYPNPTRQHRKNEMQSIGKRRTMRFSCPWPTGLFASRFRNTVCFFLLFFLIAYAVLFVFVLLTVAKLNDMPFVSSEVKNFLAGDVVDFSSADNVTGYPRDIVPNVVHYVKFGGDRLNFVEMLCILSVHVNHRPDKILIHCSSCSTPGSLSGRHWDDLVLHYRVPVEIRPFAEPTHVFGRRLSSVYHASDVARILILMEHGGIFLDGDVYVVKSLDRFLRFECTVGWPEKETMGSQILIAHKNSRFLKLWLNSYRWYRPFMWYYNAGQLPTEGILMKRPELVHRVPTHFGVHYLVNELYKKTWPQWKDYYTIHLLSRHRSYLDSESPVENFDAENVKSYQYTFGEMARLLLYNTTLPIK